MKRQRGRNRGGNGGGGSGGGKPQQHNVNRAFDSNGPDNVKVRGNAQHVFEKYQQLARDATSSGDRVLAENYLQHAEHYFRVLRAVQPNRAVADIIGRDNFASGYDIDFEDESGAQALPEETPAEGGDNSQQTQDNGEGGEQRGERQDRDREWRDRRDDRPRENRDFDRPRNNNNNNDDRPRQDRDDYRPRNNDGQPRNAGEGQPRNNDDRPSRRDRDRFRDRDRDRNYDRDRPRDPLAVIEPEGGAVAAPASAPMSAEADAGPRLRSQDGSESHAPAFLQARPAAERPEAAAEDGEVKKPRRRRAPRSFEGGDAPASSEAEEV